MYKNNDLKCNDGDEDGDHGDEDEDEDEPGELLPSLRRTRDKLPQPPTLVLSSSQLHFDDQDIPDIHILHSIEANRIINVQDLVLQV